MGQGRLVILKPELSSESSDLGGVVMVAGVGLFV